MIGIQIYVQNKGIIIFFLKSYLKMSRTILCTFSSTDCKLHVYGSFSQTTSIVLITMTFFDLIGFISFLIAMKLGVLENEAEFRSEVIFYLFECSSS